MVMIDIAVPRDIDPAVREIEGIHLFDMDDLEQVVQRNAVGRQAAAEAAEKIVQAEVQGFRRKLIAERVVPTIVALRQRLDELCRQELETLRKEFGPFTEDQDQALTTLTNHITQRIAGSLARELKELPERNEQDALTAAVSRLFQLEPPSNGRRRRQELDKEKKCHNLPTRRITTIPASPASQAYTLAVITLAIGIAVGYFARGSAPVSVPAETAQAALPLPEWAAARWAQHSCRASEARNSSKPLRRRW